MLDAATALVATLDPLCHRERVQAVAAWASGPRDAAVYAALKAGDAWRRGLAVEIAWHWKLEEDLVVTLSDASVAVRRLAASRCASRVRAELLAPGLLGADLATRRRLAHALARRRRADVAAAVAQELLDRGEIATLRPLVALLPWDVVARVEARFGPERMPWRRLAHSHPDAVLTRLGELLAAAPHAQRRQHVWAMFGPALLPLVRHHVDGVVDHLEAHPPATGHVLVSALGPLLLRAPLRTVGVIELLEPDASWLRPGDKRRRHLAALDDALLERLAIAFASHEPALCALLEAVGPARRAPLFAAVRRVRPDAAWGLGLLRSLPHAERHAEAQRLRASPQVQRDADRRRALAAWLPLDEALAELVPEGRPREREGDARATTWRLWVEAIGRERRGLTDLLEASRFLKNEQDPVRLGFLQALSALPVSLIEPEHAAAIDALVTAVAEARDSSWGTRRALEILATRLIRAHAGAPEGPLFTLGLRMLERNRARGSGLALPALDAGLRRGAEHAVVGAVLAWLRADTEREATVSTLSLAGALRERAWLVPELQVVVGEVALTSRSTSSRQLAIALWVADPAHRDARVRAVLDADESAITLDAVFAHLARHRQDWLDPFLQGRKLQGRWGSRKAGWVPHSPIACERWLPRQQRALAGLYAGLVGDAMQSLGVRARMTGQLARIPCVAVGELVPLVEHREVNVAEAALGALVWCDTPAPALDVLLQHLDSDRARVAAYALPRLAALLPDAALEEALRSVLARERLKVTVHKEVIRLLGAHRLPGAPALLAAEWARPALNRDVRLALLHAAWARLDEPWSWELLDAAAVHPDQEVPAALAAVTALAVPVQYHRLLLARLLGLADHPEPNVRLALVGHLARDALGLGTADALGAAEVAARLLLEEAPGSVVVDAARTALVVMASLPGAGPALQRAAAALIAAAAGEPVVSLHPDVPDRPMGRRLEGLAREMAWRTTMMRDRYAEPAASLRDPLLADPVWFREAAELALALLPGNDDFEGLLALVAAAPSELELAALDEWLAAAVADPRRPWCVRDVLHIDAALADQGAVLRPALLEAAGNRHGWGKSLRVRLGELRGHRVAGPSARRIEPA